MRQQWKSEQRDDHDLHDAITFEMSAERLNDTYEKHKDRIVSEIERLLPDLDLPGQWSIDIMQNGNDFWLIDMAIAENSAYYNEAVPEALRKPIEENWLPQLDTRKENFSS